MGAACCGECRWRGVGHEVGVLGHAGFGLGATDAGKAGDGMSEDEFKHPEGFGPIRWCYWNLRYLRAWDSAGRRRMYRRIRKERERLVAGGVDPEYVRLYCRWMSNPVEGAPAFRRLIARSCEITSTNHA